MYSSSDPQNGHRGLFAANSLECFFVLEANVCCTFFFRLSAAGLFPRMLVCTVALLEHDLLSWNLVALRIRAGRPVPYSSSVELSVSVSSLRKTPIGTLEFQHLEIAVRFFFSESERAVPSLSAKLAVRRPKKNEIALSAMTGCCQFG